MFYYIKSCPQIDAIILWLWRRRRCFIEKSIFFNECEALRYRKITRQGTVEKNWLDSSADCLIEEELLGPSFSGSVQYHHVATIEMYNIGP